MLLAEHLAGDAGMGWYVGLGIGFAAILAVVALVAVILTMASRISRQIRTMDRALEKTVAGAVALSDLRRVQDSMGAAIEALDERRGQMK